MRSPTTPIERSRWIYGLATALVIGAGLLWRSGLIPLPDFLEKYGGDALWALAVFLGFAFTFRRSPTARIALAAITFAWAIEFLQLYHAPWLEAIRSTRLGRLALGASFHWPDLLAYVVGVGGGVIVDRIYDLGNERHSLPS
jgi:hypothetical protein